MKSKWIEYNGKRVLYQDFSNNFFNQKAVIEELSQVQNLVTSQPENSVLILSNFSNTEITANLMPLLNRVSQQNQIACSQNSCAWNYRRQTYPWRSALQNHWPAVDVLQYRAGSKGMANQRLKRAGKNSCILNS